MYQQYDLSKRKNIEDLDKKKNKLEKIMLSSSPFQINIFPYFEQQLLLSSHLLKKKIINMPLMKHLQSQLLYRYQTFLQIAIFPQRMMNLYASPSCILVIFNLKPLSQSLVRTGDAFIQKQELKKSQDFNHLTVKKKPRWPIIKGKLLKKAI